MIIGKLQDISHYKGLSKNIDTAIDYVKKTNLLALDVAKHEIDGANVYLNRLSYVAKPFAECAAENHKNYLDLQIVIKGREGFGYAHLDNKTIQITKSYDEAKDVTKYDCIDEIIYEMSDSCFAIVFPEDVHKPQIKLCDETVEKAVIKIKI